jgi:hypothetical protein
MKGEAGREGQPSVLKFCKAGQAMVFRARVVVVRRNSGESMAWKKVTSEGLSWKSLVNEKEMIKQVLEAEMETAREVNFNHTGLYPVTYMEIPMKKQVKKLTLNKETLRSLNDLVLYKVLAGNLAESHECGSGPGASCMTGVDCDPTWEFCA